MIKKHKIIIALFSILSCLFFATQAKAVLLFPTESVINPVTETVYVPNNNSTSPGLKIYPKAASGTDFWDKSAVSTISFSSSTARCYGLAVWQSGSTGVLLASLDDGSNSLLVHYDLDSNGLPTGTPKTYNLKTTFSNIFSGSSLDPHPRGLAIFEASSAIQRVYITDAYHGFVYYLNYNGNTKTWHKATDPSAFMAESGAYNITLTPAIVDGSFDLYGNYQISTMTQQIFISTKVSSGKVLAYKYYFENGVTEEITAVDTLSGTNIEYPSYLKTNNAGSKLFVAINGALSGTADILDVPITNESTVFGSATAINCGLSNQEYSAFDLSTSENDLYFSHKELAASGNVHNIYKHDLSTSGASPKKLKTLALTDIAEIDGLVVNKLNTKIALTNSLTGDLYETGTTLPNTAPTQPTSASMEQYRSDGTTVIPAGGKTSDQQIKVEFYVADPDGNNNLIPRVYYRKKVAGSFSGPYTTVEGSAVNNKTTVEVTIPSSGQLVTGEYEWAAAVYDGALESTWAHFGGTSGTSTDFEIIKGAAAINVVNSLAIARTGDTSTDNVKLSWQSSDSSVTSFDIYYVDSAFTTEATGWQKYSNPTINGSYPTYNFTDSNVNVGDGKIRYYKIVPQGLALTTEYLTEEVLGKFDIKVAPKTTDSKAFFFSLPLEQKDYSLASVIGGQVSQYDVIATFDIDRKVISSAYYTGSTWTAASGSLLSQLQVAFVYGYSTSTSRYLTIVGKVPSRNFSRTLIGGKNGTKNIAQWISSPIAIDLPIANAGLNNSSWSATQFNQATIVSEFDADGKTINAAFHTGTTTWTKDFVNPATLVLKPGKGYMFTDPVKTSIVWSIQ